MLNLTVYSLRHAYTSLNKPAPLSASHNLMFDMRRYRSGSHLKVLWPLWFNRLLMYLVPGTSRPLCILISLWRGLGPIVGFLYLSQPVRHIKFFHPSTLAERTQKSRKLIKPLDKSAFDEFANSGIFVKWPQRIIIKIHDRPIKAGSHWQARANYDTQIMLSLWSFFDPQLQ